jgi:leucyl/phenylalanyl-tRNA--protein transferase
MGPQLDPDLLLRGYASGVFPMADDRSSDELFWVEPRARAILPPDRFHLSRSLAKRLRSGRFSVTADRDFAGVLLGCADRPQTWINGPIEAAMLALHARAQAHSVEVWQDEALVGGVYGWCLAALSLPKACSAAPAMRRRSRWPSSWLACGLGTTPCATASS